MYKKACAKMSGGPHTDSSLSDTARADSSSALITHPELFGKFRLTEPPMLGKDINLILTLANKSPAPKTVTVNLCVSSVLYTRTAVREILKEATTVNLGPKEGKQQSVGQVRKHLQAQGGEGLCSESQTAYWLPGGLPDPAARNKTGLATLVGMKPIFWHPDLLQIAPVGILCMRVLAKNMSPVCRKMQRRANPLQGNKGPYWTRLDRLLFDVGCWTRGTSSGLIQQCSSGALSWRM